MSRQSHAWPGIFVLILGAAPALAADVSVSSTDPHVWFDDTDFGDVTDWGINATGVQNLSEAQFSISDFSGVPLNTILQLNSNGTYDSYRSIVVEGDGDLTWADGGMYFDRSAQELAIGTSQTPAQLSIYSSGPDIMLKDTNDNSEAWFELQDSQYTFWGLPQGSITYRAITKTDTRAPSNSQVLDAVGNMGLGTATPAEAVDVERSAAAARFQLTSFSSAANEAAQFVQRRARGSSAAPTAVMSGDNLGLFSFRGWNGNAFTGTKAGVTVQAAGNWTPSSNPTRILFGTTPVGSTDFSTVLEITPDKKVKINGATLSVPDYVFDEDYPLMPLEELQAFIEQHGHLPGIASADEVQAEGLDLAGSQLSQLQKIEELTLYTLQQQKRIDRLEALVSSLMQ